jgi:hypothetical protein
MWPSAAVFTQLDRSDRQHPAHCVFEGTSKQRWVAVIA